MAVPFALVDVFADRPLTGNPLALVPDADDLPLGTMRAIAREFNQSETTFVVAPTTPAATWRLRSFTASGVEVFGAGHNALGAWIWLAATGRVADGDHVQEIGPDLLAVRIKGAGTRPIATLQQSAPVFGAVQPRRTALATALGLPEVALEPSVPARVVSTGAGHLLVELVDRAALDAVSPDPAALLPLLAEAGGEGCYVYARVDGADGIVATARFFNPTVGIAEDPATGTAAGPLVASLVESGAVAPGTWDIEQGVALGRRSLLRVTAAGDSVSLSGSGLVTGEGQFSI